MESEAAGWWAVSSAVSSEPMKDAREDAKGVARRKRNWMEMRSEDRRRGLLPECNMVAPRSGNWEGMRTVVVGGGGGGGGGEGGGKGGRDGSGESSLPIEEAWN